jgi:hypothetical protein
MWEREPGWPETCPDSVRLLPPRLPPAPPGSGVGPPPLGPVPPAGAPFHEPLPESNLEQQLEHGANDLAAIYTTLEVIALDLHDESVYREFLGVISDGSSVLTDRLQRLSIGALMAVPGHCYLGADLRKFKERLHQVAIEGGLSGSAACLAELLAFGEDEARLTYRYRSGRYDVDERASLTPTVFSARRWRTWWKRFVTVRPSLAAARSTVRSTGTTPCCASARP